VSFPRTAPGLSVVHATCYTAASYVTHFKWALNFGEARARSNSQYRIRIDRGLPADRERSFHVLHAIIFGAYNPGLGTAIATFIPLGIYALITIQRSGAGTLWMHATGLVTTIGIHVLIIVHVFGKRTAHP
jgi:hypothetical protein